MSLAWAILFVVKGFVRASVCKLSLVPRFFIYKIQLTNFSGTGSKKIQSMKVLKFVFGGFFIIASLGMFAQKEVLTGLISVILGAIILPPVSEKIKEKFNQWNSRGIRCIAYVVLLSLVGMTSKKNKFPEPNPQVSSDKVIKSENSKVQNNITSVAVEEPEDNSEFWQNYSPEVKKRILEMIKNKDCQGLQNEFNIADQNNESQMRRTGRNNADLLDFIDNAMADMDCYK